MIPIAKINQKSAKTAYLIGSIIAFILLLAGAVLMMYPLVWMVFTSIKPFTEVYTTFFPSVVQLDAYKIVWQELPLVRGFLNSFLATVPVVLVQVFVSAMAAFAFAKINFRGKNVLFMALLATMMIPFTVIMIPQVMVFKALGMSHNIMSVTIPKMFGAVMTVFFLRQFLYGIPDSLIEASKLDGGGYNATFAKVVLPLIMPAVATQFILSFIGNWNDFLGPLLFIREKEWYTLPLIINEYAGNNGITEYIPKLMAASLVTMVPIIIVFVAFQKKIVSSIVFSGVKG